MPESLKCRFNCIHDERSYDFLLSMGGVLLSRELDQFIQLEMHECPEPIRRLREVSDESDWVLEVMNSAGATVTVTTEAGYASVFIPIHNIVSLHNASDQFLDHSHLRAAESRLRVRSQAGETPLA